MTSTERLAERMARSRAPATAASLSASSAAVACNYEKIKPVKVTVFSRSAYVSSSSTLVMLVPAKLYRVLQQLLCILLAAHLVQDQQLGLPHQRPRQRDALSLPAG